MLVAYVEVGQSKSDLQSEGKYVVVVEDVFEMQLPEGSLFPNVTVRQDFFDFRGANPIRVAPEHCRSSFSASCWARACIKICCGSALEQSLTVGGLHLAVVRPSN